MDETSHKSVGALVILSASALLLTTACENRNHPGPCSELTVEIAIPQGVSTVKRIDIVTPEGMGGDGAPKPVRFEGGNEIYQFTGLAFDHEQKRDLAVGLESGETLVLPLPAGRQRSPAFTPWRYFLYATAGSDPTWHIMNGTPVARTPVSSPARARFRFAHSSICQ